MSDPKYRPRDYAARPEQFGRLTHIEWMRPRNKAEAIQHRAANIQHVFAYCLRSALKDSRLTISEFCERVDISYDRMGRVLRGEVVMRMEDLGAADMFAPTFFKRVDKYLPNFSLHDVRSERVEAMSAHEPHRDS